ncbi:MAG: MMPL family transporter [Planctomycetaceae bacterium]
MFQRLGNFNTRFWPVLLVGWVGAAVVLGMLAPAWDDVVQDGEFAYLPKSSPSLRAEELFEEAFPDDLLRSSVVLVVRRENGLDERDDEFIQTVLTPRLERIQPLTDIAELGSANEEVQRARYREMSAALDGLPLLEGEAPDLPPIPEHVKLAAVRDWHADLFSSEEDPDPQSDAGTSLGTRIALRLAAEGYPDPPLAEAIDARLRTVRAQSPDEEPDRAAPASAFEIPAESRPAEPPQPVIVGVRDAGDRAIGSLLRSRDDEASLVIVELSTEFMENRNRPVLEKISAVVESTHDTMRRLEPMRPVPRIDLSGTATVGRDMRQAAKDSADNTHLATLILVVILLLVIYRAPVLALIPLLTVAAAVKIALSSLAILAEAGAVSLFSGIEVYVTVVLYGAGVDYCLFLIARYKEELDGGATIEEAIRESLGKVGAALTASAGTVMCGIGMMVFASFGKFQEAGVAMASSLFVVLLAALTFTPPLLRLTGRWAFWPRMRTERIAAPGWISPTSLVSRILETAWARDAWEKVGRALLARPATIWLASIALMLPFAVIGVVWYNHLSYGLLSELPAQSPSVEGALAVQEHFPAGTAGPVTVLIRNPDVDFASSEGQGAIRELTDRLYDRSEELRISDIRSVWYPLGLHTSLSPLAERESRRRAPQYYVSSVPGHAGQVTRLDVVFADDPFSRDSILEFERLRETIKNTIREIAAGRNEGDMVDDEAMRRFESLGGVRDAWDDDLVAADTSLFYIGPTPSLRDLKQVTDVDQIRIDILVLAGVFAILVILLRRPAICAYLIVSVFFSYLVTLGVTFALFWLIDPNFAGLDWKVPMFLFTILIAVGEDYNIFLMTRIDEEQKLHGPVHGVTVALARTGKIISSCGFIMAGTFSSLLFGTLTGMHQLGFALAFGVLLDTFVVRPILVPAYLILLYGGRFGAWGRFLGAREYVPAQPSAPVEATHEPSGTP